MNAKWRKRTLGIGSGVMLGVAALNAQTGKPTAEKIDYNRDVRPIITKCFTCHGPSSETGVAGLRLDTFKTATQTLRSGKRAIVPGNPKASELIERINATDDSLMPPPETHKVLSAEDKQLLSDWIAQGAEYKTHWAFVTPVRPAIPTPKDAAWARNDIDKFILQKLEQHNLKPEAEADRRTLLRRVTLDLTGLPPTAEEVDAFVADKRKDAYERVVDRLLASPRYGERMAMDWMDYARYADSNGYQADFERFQSRWRDWVINAFNKNEPYDQFTVEQIAGDLLPNPTMDQKLATAFNRNHRINTEGGVIVEEWRIETVVDRVETTSAVWLGLTAGCARCHDHKFDPFTQKDFYQMGAYFNNVPESGSGEERPMSHPPTMRAPTPEQSAELSQLQKQIASLTASMDKRLANNARAAANWKIEAAVPVITDGLVARPEFRPDGKGFQLVGKATYDSGRATGAVVTNADSYADLGNVGDFDVDQPFSYGAWIKSDNGMGAPFARMDSGHDYRGWECSLYNGQVQAHLINKWPDNALKITSKMPVPNGKWVHVFFTYDGSHKPAGFKMFLDGKQVETNVENDNLTATIRTTVSTKIGRRTDSDLFSGQVDDFALFSRALKAEEVAKLASTHPAARLVTIPADKRTKEQSAEITRLWSLEHDKTFAQLEHERTPATQRMDALNAAIPEVMVMAEMPKPRDAYVLIRGQYDQHGEKVQAALPSFLPPMPKGAPNNRLGFAKWIVAPENPLTARVTVNRLWERFFGAGIVSTVEDFGTRAEFPTHPELLDYLATEFLRLKWDLKAMIKEMVMSATYRQSSAVSAAKMQADPTNKFLSRGPRFRLTGEVIRDQALFAAGLLKEKIGGPSVRPYQPNGIWDETNFYGNLRNYKADTDGNQYRRSLYTIWKRTAAPPNMLLFDVPSRETCRVHRSRTDTPLQALTLLNDETYIEAARVLAQKMIREGGKTPEERLTFGFRRVLGRSPNANEMKIMTTSLAKRLAKFRAEPDAARDLSMVGDYPIDLGLDKAELAAFTVTASTLLNLDETLNKE